MNDARADAANAGWRAVLDWGAHAVSGPEAWRGIAMEVGCLAAFATLYPWGLLADVGAPPGHYRTAALSPVQRGLLAADAEAAGTPILLVHGLAHNRATFTVLARALRRRGFHAVHALNYNALTVDIRRTAAWFGHCVERVCEQSGSERVHVVGHSLGGLLARYYVQCLGGDARVHTLVTLGTPHAGTLWADLLPTPLGCQLRPGSDVLTELAGPAPGCGTRFVSVWSELDHLVLPQASARLEHADLDVTALRLPALGHLSLSMDPRAVRAVLASLVQLGGADRVGAQAPAPVLAPAS